MFLLDLNDWIHFNLRGPRQSGPWSQVKRGSTKENNQTYPLPLGPWPNVLVIELNTLSETVDGTNMLARTLTATVSPGGGTGALRLTIGDPPGSLSTDGESLPTSVRPDTKGLIPESPWSPFGYPPPGNII